MRSTFALTALSGLVSGEAGFWLGRAKRKAIFLCAIGLLLLSAWAVALAAAVIALAQDYGPLIASLAVAGLLAASAIVLIAIMMILDRLARRKARIRKSETSLYAASAALALPLIIRNRPLLLLALAGGGGVILANLLGSKNADRQAAE